VGSSVDRGRSIAATDLAVALIRIGAKDRDGIGGVACAEAEKVSNATTIQNALRRRAVSTKCEYSLSSECEPHGGEEEKRVVAAVDVAEAVAGSERGSAPVMTIVFGERGDR